MADGTSVDRHECQRCGSDEWEYVDYGGCSKCRSHEDRQQEDAPSFFVVHREQLLRQPEHPIETRPL